MALIEVMDCHNALEVLGEEIGRKHSLDTRMWIFREALPPLGADERERCDYTRVVMNHMTCQLTPQEVGHAWFQVQHRIPAEYWR